MRRSLLAAVLLAAVWLPAAAQSNAPAIESWAVRFGVADDPDQALVGVQLDLGELWRGARLRPDFQLGAGDDHLVLSAAGQLVHPFERVDAPFVPYAGGGLVLGLIDRDRPPGIEDDTDFEIAVEAVGGVEWRMRGDRSFHLELNLVFGDVHDIELLAGVRF